MIASKITEVNYKAKPVTRLPYPAGAYDNNVKYVTTENVAPYVEFEGLYYVMNKVGEWLGSSQNSNPQQDYATYGQNATWIPFENYKAVYIELLMVKLGLIGKSVYYDNYTFSQRGKDASNQETDDYQLFDPARIGQSDCPFTPNILIDWVSGLMQLLKLKAVNADVAGDLNIRTLRLTASTSTGNEPVNGSLIYGFHDTCVLPSLAVGEYRCIEYSYPQITRVTSNTVFKVQNETKDRILPLGDYLHSKTSVTMTSYANFRFIGVGGTFDGTRTFWTMLGGDSDSENNIRNAFEMN